MTDADVVRVEQDGPVLSVTINRPQAHNALSTEVIDGLDAAVSLAERSADIRAVVLTGTGDRAFCAGADLRELQSMDRAAAHRQISRGQDTFRRLELSCVPVVAAVNGLALGGGFELVLSSTVPVLSTRASLGLPETILGLIPGYGGTQRLPRAVGSQVAAHLMLTGERLGAERAYTLGLTPLAPVEPERLMETATELATTIARQGPVAARAVLAAMREGLDAGFDPGLHIERELASDAIAGTESDEGIAAFLEKRAPVFTDRPVREGDR